MFNDNKEFVKNLTKNIKELKTVDLPMNKKYVLNENYITKNEYKEVVGFYNYMRELETDLDNNLNFDLLEKNIENNKLRFKYLNKCCNCIYEFASTLRCSGPLYIAKEMTRQGKEIDYINNNILNK